MKKLSALLLGTLLFAACNNRPKDTQSNDNDEQTTSEVPSAMVAGSGREYSDELKVVKASYISPDSSTVQLSAEVPVKNGTPLADSILTYLDENIQHDFLSTYLQTGNAKKTIYLTGETILAEMNDEINELKTDMEEDENEEKEIEDADELSYAFSWERQQAFTKEADTPHYVTYLENGYSYEGGAHGYSWSVGTTFDKKTGRHIGTEILKDTDSESWKSLFRSRLLHYFNPTGNETLENYLLIDINELTLGNMSIREDGFIFQYQPYEISYFAAGLPYVKLSFDEIKPFLTKRGLRLISPK